MHLNTLLVCLTTPDHAETLLKLAVPLARRHNAHLVGLHTIEALLVYPGIAMHIPDPVYASFNDAQKEEADKVKAVFTKHTQNEDFQSEFRLVRAEGISANARMVESARAADLVIMSREDKVADHTDQRHAQAQVIRESGRPVIIVPNGYDGPEVGQNILLGWSDTREATRAAHDMLLVAQDGAGLTVLRVGSVNKDALHDPDGVDISETLSRHGLNVTLENRDADSTGVAGVLNQVAFEKGADLIVTGAFGHSRAYDFVIGAATHELLRDARLPVLFSK
ncbi:MAG: universal stress protein [Silicimonas sp.]|nr:universal stress protein [Silicimonas sp.]